ncbi:MAG: hypothetical protein JW808_07495 [Victivallales bacterium]|nr:hypothetical protein [Victivallales bacterium]
MIRKLLCMSCLLVSVRASAVPKGQPTMAVLPFQLSPVIETVQIGDLVVNRTLVEREFSNHLIAFLTKSRKFNMLSRTHIESVINENMLTESDWIKPGEAERIGKLLVADYLVTGVINRMEFQVIEQNIQITGETTPRIVATFKSQFQIIESQSGKIVAADQVLNRLKSADVRREIPASERKDWTLADFRELLFERSATEMGNAILSGVYPVKIIEVAADSVVLNRGQGVGVNVGDIFVVVSQGEPIVDVDTGETLGGSEEEVGMIEITSVEVKFSKAKILKGKEAIQYGDVCRMKKKEIPQQEPAYPRATPGW